MDAEHWREAAFYLEEDRRVLVKALKEARAILIARQKGNSAASIEEAIAHLDKGLSTQMEIAI